ncbi:MAG: 30S ribosomal protein S8 [Deltaproteobacteria bacterium]|nr:30S ribosomal protein S8 [Deltaproteobacteria bacterium]
MTTDPIADMLTRVRNAIQSNHESVDVPLSLFKVDILEVLKKNELIKDFELDRAAKKAKVFLNYFYDGSMKRIPAIRHLKRVSAPSRRVYLKNSDLPGLVKGLGVSLLSTSRGVMTADQAFSQKLGGEHVCTIW